MKLLVVLKRLRQNVIIITTTLIIITERIMAISVYFPTEYNPSEENWGKWVRSLTFENTWHFWGQDFIREDHSKININQNTNHLMQKCTELMADQELIPLAWRRWRDLHQCGRCDSLRPQSQKRDYLNILEKPRRSSLSIEDLFLPPAPGYLSPRQERSTQKQIQER